MKKPQNQPADTAELRRHAEERLKRQRTEDREQRTELETVRLVHELQVHQIELEMQNEELQQARIQAEALIARYSDLYDFAPAGYLTLDREGAIRQLNLTGARLLGVERSRLVNRRFGLFVAEGDRRALNDFLQKVFASEAKEGCEVTLPQAGHHPLFVRIEGTRSADGQECLAVVLDLTARRQAEEQARAAQAETQRLLALSDQSRRVLLSAAEDERAAAAALRESERRLSEAQRMAQLGYWIWDIKTGDVEWSEEVFRIFHLDPDEFTPHIDSILALSPWPEDCTRDKELLRKAMESHEKGVYEQRFLRPDKSTAYYHSTFQGTYDDEGNLISIVGRYRTSPSASGRRKRFTN